MKARPQCIRSNLGLVCITTTDAVRYKTITRKRLLSFDEAEQAFVKAEASFDQLSSASHRAAAWMARGDLANRRGDDRGAAALYRRAAEALQDFHF